MDSITRIEAFRDFFHYGTKEKMQEAFARLALHKALHVDYSWDEEEFLFNKLFIGPMSPFAPMTASVYLEPDGKINKTTTQKIKSLYFEAGLELEGVGSFPEDNLSFELEALRILKALCAVDENFLPIYQELLCEHMSKWIPLFVSRAKEGTQAETAVFHVLTLLDEWIKNEVAS